MMIVSRLGLERDPENRKAGENRRKFDENANKTAKYAVSSTDRTLKNQLLPFTRSAHRTFVARLVLGQGCYSPNLSQIGQKLAEIWPIIAKMGFPPLTGP